MEPDHRERAERVRERVRGGAAEAREIRRALAGVPVTERDAWIDLVLGIGELPEDGPELPRDGVPYLPCTVEVLLRVVEMAEIGASDVVVDVGAGIGRAAACLHLLSGATVVGVEIQPRLVRAARELTERLGLSRVTFAAGDAVELGAEIADATVLFLYCPFGRERVARWLDAIEPVARARPIRIACVDLTLPPRAWLGCSSASGELAVYRSRL